MDPNSLAIISNRFREPGILKIESLVRIFQQSNGLVERSIRTIKRALKKQN